MNTLFRNRSGRASFTLAEMLVAVAILSIMLAFLGTLMVSVTSVSSKGTQEAQDADNARTILDLMNRELEAGVSRADLTNWITNSTSPAETLAYYTQNVGSAIDGSSSSASYRPLSYVVYALSNSATYSSLYRGDSSVQWTTTTDEIPLGYSGTNANPAVTNSADVLDGVVAFQVTFLEPDGTYYSSYTTNCVAVGVSLALVNSTAYNLLISTGQLQNLSTALVGAYTTGATVTNIISPKTAWENVVSTGALNGYPQQVKTGLRFYERFIILPTPPL